MTEFTEIITQLRVAYMLWVSNQP